VSVVSVRRRIAPTTFPSGPGFEVFVGEAKIGAIGKHHREIVWWYQVDPKILRHLSVKGPIAGTRSNRAMALAALLAEWKTI
jgi:hypothetical protein